VGIVAIDIVIVILSICGIIFGLRRKWWLVVGLCMLLLIVEIITFIF